jgi:TolB-like protein
MSEIRRIMMLGKRVWIILAMTMAFFMFAAIAIAADNKASVAVLDFESVGSEEHLGKAVAEIVRTELIDAKQFRVLERAQINKALSEQRFQQSGVIDEKSATEIGKILGADLIIIGSVVKIGSSYTINSRLIDIKTGEATLGKNVTGSDLNLLTNLSRTLIDKLFGTPKKEVQLLPSLPATTYQPRMPSSSRTGAVNWGNGKAYFFKSNHYIRYDIASGRADSDYPKPINAQTWPGVVWTDGIDAVVNWGNGKAYFFRDDRYIRYDIAADRADPGYPKRLNAETWPGWPWRGGIDGAVNWGNGKAYFFKGNQYLRYDIGKDRVDPGYPKLVNDETWPGMIWTDGFDDVVLWENGKAFFFKDNQCIRYDLPADRADPGYPQPIDSNTWPGLAW